MIKNILILKWGWIKNNFETTFTNCGSKEKCKTTVIDFFYTFKTIVTNGGFLHLKKNLCGYLYGYKRLL